MLFTLCYLPTYEMDTEACCEVNMSNHDYRNGIWVSITKNNTVGISKLLSNML